MAILPFSSFLEMVLKFPDIIVAYSGDVDHPIPVYIDQSF